LHELLVSYSSQVDNAQAMMIVQMIKQRTVRIFLYCIVY